MVRPHRRVLLVGGLVMVAQTPTPGDYFSCTAGATGIGTAGLNITIVVSGTRVSSSQPLTVTVAAINNTATSISWSSVGGTCSLRAAVHVGAAWVPVTPASATCAVDATLVAGEQRTETFLWYGDVRRNGKAERLRPGSYQMRGEAGSLGTSVSTTVTVLPS